MSTDSPESMKDISTLKQKIQDLEQLLAELKDTRDELQESAAKYRFLVEQMTDTVWTLDMNMKPTYVGQSSIKNLGFTPEERMGQHLSEMVTADTYSKLMELLAQEMKKEQEGTADPNRFVVIEMEYYHKDGHTLWFENRVHAIRDKDGKIVGFHGVSRDITERKRREDWLRDSTKKYQKLSMLDNLTKLYNLGQFYSQIKIEIDRSSRYNQPLTLVFLDLDDFKTFNDTYGHIEGDRVLKRIGRVIKSCLRSTDFAYRYGGEEFTAILPMTSRSEGVIIAERIKSEIKRQPFSPLPGRKVHVTVSIGLAQYKQQEDMKSFVKRADQYMYYSKKHGKDRVCHDTCFL